MAQQNVMRNPYGAPRAAVGDAAEDFQPVRILAVSGRIGRVRYVVYSFMITLALMLVAGMAVAFLGTFGMVVLVAAYIAMVVVSFMLTIQRSHDFNMSGWFSLLALVPLVNFIFWFIPGTEGPNRFGARTPPNSTLVLVGVWTLPIVFIGAMFAAISVGAYQEYMERAAQSQQSR